MLFASLTFEYVDLDGGRPRYGRLAGVVAGVDVGPGVLDDQVAPETRRRKKRCAHRAAFWVSFTLGSISECTSSLHAIKGFRGLQMAQFKCPMVMHPFGLIHFWGPFQSALFLSMQGKACLWPV